MLIMSKVKILFQVKEATLLAEDGTVLSYRYLKLSEEIKSSFATFVCSSTIAIMAALNVNLPKKEVIQLTCVCERHIETQSDGMDQAISIMAKTGFAELKAINPFRANDVQLPAGGSFVILL